MHHEGHRIRIRFVPARCVKILTPFVTPSLPAETSRSTALELAATSNSTVGIWMIIPSRGGGSAALGRHRERLISVRDSLAAGSPTDERMDCGRS